MDLAGLLDGTGRGALAERLLKLHRHHLGTQIRDAGIEVSIYRGALPAASSAALAAQLLGREPGRD
jgi:RNA polymerase sigma-70 factor, ECF subfamily